MFRASRERLQGPDPLIDVKILLLVLGITSGVIGMIRNDRRFIDAAIVIIAIGILLRFLTRKRGAKSESSDESGTSGT